MSVRNLPQYPAASGNKNHVVAVVAGPNPYAVISVATPPTGGQRINASQLGLTSIDEAHVSASDNGQYGARVIMPNNPIGSVAYIILQWFTLATGAEVGAIDLSARTVRLDVTGV